MKVCPKCGNVADTNFCSKCGSAMEMVEGKETSLQEERIDESESENTNQEEQEVIKVMSPEENSVNNGISQKFNKETVKNGKEKFVEIYKKCVLSLKKFFKNKWTKRILIILGVLVALLIALVIVAYIFAPSVKDDFNQKSKHELHGLTYYTPKSWKKDSELVWKKDPEKNTDVYVKKDSDGETLLYMEVSYEGENCDLSYDEIFNNYVEDNGQKKDKDQFSMSNNWTVSTLYQPDPDNDEELYIGLVSCDDSIFSFKFLSSLSLKNGTDVFNDIISSAEFEKYKNPKVLKELIASYGGKMTEGTEINNDNQGITVTAKYDIGGSEILSNSKWKIQNPGTLQADKTSSFTIEYKGVTCTLNIECSTVSENGYKAKCKTYSYDSLSRNPADYEGAYIKVSGKVLQEQSGVYRVATKGNYDDVVYVTYMGDSGSRILEGDKVTIYGTYYGVYSYTTVMGASVTIPRITAKYID